MNRQDDTGLLREPFRARADSLVAAIQREGLPFRVFETLRSNARQAQLYAQGRRWDQGAGLWSIVDKTKVVTWARPGASPHAWGLAMDCVLIPNHPWFEGEPQPTGPWDAGSEDRLAVRLAWQRYGRAAAACELVWGGNWTEKQDLPHVELPRWQALRPARWRDIVAEALKAQETT